MADILIPRHDPGNIYVLSSRFHKYFLKNLDQHDINVRIMRMRDTTKEPSNPFSVPSRPLLTTGYTKPPTPAPQPTAIPPFSPFPAGGSTSYSHFSTPYTSIAPTFNINHQLPVSKTPAPYAFEPVGVLNKGIRNPFLHLNSGERPSFYNNELHRNYDTHPSSHSSSYYFSSNHA